MQSASASGERTPPHERIVVATPLEPAPEEELQRVSWPRTVLRLALQPEEHPWNPEWRLRRKAPLVVLGAALLLLLVFAASGCASVPPQSLLQRTTAPAPANGARCE